MKLRPGSGQESAVFHCRTNAAGQGDTHNYNMQTACSDFVYKIWKTRWVLKAIKQRRLVRKSVLEYALSWQDRQSTEGSHDLSLVMFQRIYRTFRPIFANLCDCRNIWKESFNFCPAHGDTRGIRVWDKGRFRAVEMFIWGSSRGLFSSTL